MPKTYAVGDKVLASEYNEVVKTAGLYAASSAGSDTYAITVAPVPGTYAAGDVYHFKADVANTGPATLNVNSLGAKTLKKYVSSGKVDLETGDILASQFLDVIYDGTDMVVISRLASDAGIFKNVTASKNAADASTTQNIAHGLGRTPRNVRIKAMGKFSGANVQWVESNAVYDGTTQRSLSVYLSGTTDITVGTEFKLNLAATSGAYQEGVVTFDATNIIITWTKTGSPTGNYDLLCEAVA